jgi:cell division septum initiation protein DivIVA
VGSAFGLLIQKFMAKLRGDVRQWQDKANSATDQISELKSQITQLRGMLTDREKEILTIGTNEKLMSERLTAAEEREKVLKDRLKGLQESQKVEKEVRELLEQLQHSEQHVKEHNVELLDRIKELENEVPYPLFHTIAHNTTTTTTSKCHVNVVFMQCFVFYCFLKCGFQTPQQNYAQRRRSSTVDEVVQRLSVQLCEKDLELPAMEGHAQMLQNEIQRLNFEVRFIFFTFFFFGCQSHLMPKNWKIC